MMTSILAALLAASAPAQDTPPKVDPITVVCMQRFAENVKLVAEGGEPNSLVIPLLGLSDETSAFLTQQCDRFDDGAKFMFNLIQSSRAAPPVEEEDEDEGRVPDRTNDLVSFRR